jgi:murein hydrolase activator
MILITGCQRPKTPFIFIVWFGLVITTAFIFKNALRAQERDGTHQVVQDTSHTPLTQKNESEKQDTLKQHEQDLKAAREAQRQSAETEAALKREIEQIGSDRRKFNQALIDTVEKLRNLESKMSAIEARLKPLDEHAASIRQSLDSRHDVIGEVLAALQRIGRRPPPALMSSPEDALQTIRSAMVLGAVLPEMRHQVATLTNDLSDLVSVRQEIAAEQNKLKAQAVLFESENKRMSALIEERQKQQAEREKTLRAEQKRAADLAHQVDNLKDLIAKLEENFNPTTRTNRRSEQADPRFAALNDPGRLAPAIEFASRRGQVPLPVNGIKLRGFGAPDGIGGVEKGLSIATRAAAEVTAPADGWVVYAGTFRSYGQLLILNVGGGYHVLLAGMERISVDLGQFVLTGEPVAAMGDGSQNASVLAIGSNRPVLYIEFRKDGTPVDPGPWWVVGEGEKVRG